MTPEELAKLHPHLYHATDPTNLEGICKHGLLSTRSILSLFDWSGADCDAYVRRRRTESERVTHTQFGAAMITDNKPLIPSKLEPYLDDNLTLADWCEKLNERVFFWPDEEKLRKLLNAKAYRHLDRLVLVFDTASLAEAYADQMELSPINSGAALFLPAARRGDATFTALLKHDYDDWRRLRMERGETKSLDSIKEVTVVGGIDDVKRFLVDHYVVTGRGR
jgi:hypothetical protein